MMEAEIGKIREELQEVRGGVIARNSEQTEGTKIQKLQEEIREIELEIASAVNISTSQTYGGYCETDSWN